MSVDPSIRIWKTSQPQGGYTNWWPCWRSPDVFVDNDGDRLISWDGSFKYYQNIDEVGEPLKGNPHNRLFAVVRNLGTNPANNVEVMFSYAPYGWVGGTLYKHVHFKEIGRVYVDLGSVGSSNAEKEVEIQWDLSNLTENNGGLWPAPIAFFNHFCVKIDIIYLGDINISNNWTQHNFANISSSSACPPLYLLVANTDDRQREGDIVAKMLPRDWTLKLRGLDRFKEPYSTAMWRMKVERGTGEEKATEERETVRKASKEHEGELQPGSLSLKPMEERLVTLTIITSEEELERQFIEVALRMDDGTIGGVSFGVQKEKPRIGLLPRQRMAKAQRYILLPSHQVIFHEKKTSIKGGKD